LDQPRQSEIAGAADTAPEKCHVRLSRGCLAEALDQALCAPTLTALKSRIAQLRDALEPPREPLGLRCPADESDALVSLRRDVFLGELAQILDAQTIERAHYYLRRLKTSIAEVKTSGINEINLRRWKEYDGILTDSLWVLPKRDSSGAHVAEYWGNFVPQIPRQMMLRYTKSLDWVLDMFAGSGTTLIECRRLGRNGIGIELNPDVAQRARELVEREPNQRGSVTDIVIGDSGVVDLRPILVRHGIERVQLLIMHPPYHDIIRFSTDPRDLSNAPRTAEFLEMFGRCLDNATPFLEAGRYFALVIGDRYSRGEWIPLGFYCMSEVLKRDFTLKAIIVKNFDETRGKRRQHDLWRYRALAGGFYVFKHEYVMVFRKRN
jgi:hypothetical protein